MSDPFPKFNNSKDIGYHRAGTKGSGFGNDQLNGYIAGQYAGDGMTGSAFIETTAAHTYATDCGYGDVTGNGISTTRDTHQPIILFNLGSA